MSNGDEYQLLRDIITFAMFPIMGLITWYLTYRSGKKNNAISNEFAVKKLASDLQERADTLADKLKESDLKKAISVRESIESYVNNALSVIEIKGDNRHDKIEANVESRNALLYLELKNIMTVITDIIKDLNDMKKDDNNEMIKMDKRLSMLEQFSYGTRTKSENPIFSDVLESAEHKDAPGEGIFADTEEESQERKEGKKPSSTGQKHSPPEP